MRGDCRNGRGSVADLSLKLIDANGELVAEEIAHDAEGVVRTCLEHPGVYTLVLRMADGAGDYVVSSFMGGDRGEPDGGAALASGGTCESPTVLVPGHSYIGNTGEGSNDSEGTCATTGEGAERVYRLDIAQRQRVTIEVSADFDAVLYVRKGTCDDDGNEVACNDDSGPKLSRVETVLEPGMYFVFVDGNGEESGSFRLHATTHDAPSLAEVCRNARPLAAPSRVVGSTVIEGFDNVNATCGGEARGIDTPFRFNLAARARVRLIETSSDYRPVLHLRRDCLDPSSEVACRDADASDQVAVFTGVLEAGTYWVFADAESQESAGSFTLSAETAPENGGGNDGARIAGDACGDAIALPGTTGKIEGDTFGARDDAALTCGSKDGGPDLFYRVDLAHKSRVSARITSSDAELDLVLLHGCSDTSRAGACGHQAEVLDPGTYFLVVKGHGAGAFGRFTLTYRITDLQKIESACARAPLLPFGRPESASTAGGSDRFSSSCGEHGDRPSASADRVYRFVVSKPTKVKASFGPQGFGAALTIRRTCSDDAHELACVADVDGKGGSLRVSLEPGTYYAVVDGIGVKSEGAFTLRLDPLPGGGR